MSLFKFTREQLQAELARREKEEPLPKVPELSEEEQEDLDDEEHYNRVESEKAELEAKFDKNYEALQKKEATIKAKIEKLQIQLTEEAEKYGLPIEEGGDTYRPVSGEKMWRDDTLYTQEAIDHIMDVIYAEFDYGNGEFAADGEWYYANWNSSNC